jgi:hypothetical protein
MLNLDENRILPEFSGVLLGYSVYFKAVFAIKKEKLNYKIFNSVQELRLIFL